MDLFRGVAGVAGVSGDVSLAQIASSARHDASARTARHHSMPPRQEVRARVRTFSLTRSRWRATRRVPLILTRGSRSRSGMRPWPAARRPLRLRRSRAARLGRSSRPSRWSCCWLAAGDKAAREEAADRPKQDVQRDRSLQPSAAELGCARSARESGWRGRSETRHALDCEAGHWVHILGLLETSYRGP